MSDETYKLVRGAVGMVAGMGASKVVKQLIYSNTFKPDTKSGEIMFKIGVFAIGGFVHDVANKHIQNDIDDGVKIVKKVRAEFQDAVKKSKERDVVEVKNDIEDVADEAISALREHLDPEKNPNKR